MRGCLIKFSNEENYLIDFVEKGLSDASQKLNSTIGFLQWLHHVVKPKTLSLLKGDLHIESYLTAGRHGPAMPKMKTQRNLRP